MQDRYLDSVVRFVRRLPMSGTDVAGRPADRHKVIEALQRLLYQFWASDPKRHELLAYVRAELPDQERYGPKSRTCRQSIDVTLTPEEVYAIRHWYKERIETGEQTDLDDSRLDYWISICEKHKKENNNV